MTFSSRFSSAREEWVKSRYRRRRLNREVGARGERLSWGRWQVQRSPQRGSTPENSAGFFTSPIPLFVTEYEEGE